MFQKEFCAVAVVLLGLFVPALAGAEGNVGDIYQFSPVDIDGKTKPLKSFSGKVLVIVNTASQCGYTKQYESLEKLYAKYKSKGLEILAFPSNDFGGQEPGSEKEIKAFCQARFNVTFPLFSKLKVKGDGKAPLYKWLTENPSNQGEIQWNFEKFIVNRKGQVVQRFPSKVDPIDAKMTSVIEKIL